MKIAAFTVLYNTPQDYITTLQNQFSKLGIQNFFTIDNSGTSKGYAEGINTLLKKHLNNFDLFIICNPDISLTHITSFTEPATHFDIYGFAMEQEKTTYYGGELDPLRLSGGLITTKPRERWQPVEFVSGSLLVVKQQVVQEIGLLDEGFGMYYEDVEFCFRARKAGFKVGIDTKQRYTHFEVSKQNAQKATMLARSRLRFLLQHGSAKQKLYELVRLPKTLMEDGKVLLGV